MQAYIPTLKGIYNFLYIPYTIYSILVVVVTHWGDCYCNMHLMHARIVVAIPKSENRAHTTQILTLCAAAAAADHTERYKQIF